MIKVYSESPETPTNKAPLKGADIHKSTNKTSSQTAPHSIHPSKRPTCIILNTAPSTKRQNSIDQQRLKHSNAMPTSHTVHMLRSSPTPRFDASAIVQQARIHHLQSRDFARGGGRTDTAYSPTGLTNSCSSALLASKTIAASFWASADFG